MTNRPCFSRIAGSIAFVALVTRVWPLLAADGMLEVAVFDVGQADAILVTCPDGDHHLLIDSGDTRYRHHQPRQAVIRKLVICRGCE